MLALSFVLPLVGCGSFLRLAPHNFLVNCPPLAALAILSVALFQAWRGRISPDTSVQLNWRVAVVFTLMALAAPYVERAVKS